MRQPANTRPRKPRLAIALALVTASVLAAAVACEGDNNSGPQVGTTEPTAPASLLATRSPSEATRRALLTPVASAQSRDAFAALLIASQRATYRVRYDTSSESGERGDSYVIFNRPPNARVDTITEGETEPSSQIIVGPDGSTFACSFDGGRRSCSEIDAFSGPLPLTAGPLIFPAAASFDSISVARLDDETVAGAPAPCFRVLPANAADESAADYCFTAEGVPVYATGPSGVVVASELSSPSDADFALPTP